MMKCFLTLFLSMGFAFAQTGTLIINYSPNFALDPENVSIKVINVDDETMLDTTFVKDGFNFSHQMQLVPDAYYVVVKDDQLNLTQIKPFEMDRDKKIILDINAEISVVECKADDCGDEENGSKVYESEYEGVVDIYTSWGEDDRYDFSFGIKSLASYDFSPDKTVINGGIDYGLSYEYHQLFRRDFVQTNIKYKNQAYHYFNGVIGLYLKLQSLKRKTIFRVGAQYHIPLYLRQHKRLGNTIIKDYKFHNWNDVRVHASIGYDNFHVFASYRPSAFIKGDDRPDLPVLNFGLRFIFRD